MKIKREVKLGIFAVSMILCLYFGILYLKGTDLFTSNKTYYAMIDHTGGLQNSASILLRGVKIGSVSDISFDPAKNEKVVVKLSVKNKIKIPTDSYMKLFTNGFLGSKALELVMGTSSATFAGDAVLPVKSETDIFESASMSIEEIIGDAKRLLESLEKTSTSINDLINSNSKDIEGTIKNLRLVMEQFSDGRIDNTLQNINRFSHTLGNSSEKIDNIVTNLDGVTTTLAEADLRTTLDSLSTSVGHLSGILAKVSNGDGTLGHLVSDDALYDSLVVASSNLSLLLEDLRLHPKRYINISVFGGGNKEKKNKQ